MKIGKNRSLKKHWNVLSSNRYSTYFLEHQTRISILFRPRIDRLINRCSLSCSVNRLFVFEIVLANKTLANHASIMQLVPLTYPMFLLILQCISRHAANAE